MALNFLPQAERLLSGTLSAFLSAVATTMTVNNPPDANKLPTFFELDPDSDDPETVRVVAVAGNVCTIERGVYNGGVGREHQANTPYKQKFSQKHWDALIDAIQTGYLTEDPTVVLTQVDTNTFTITGVDRTAYLTAGRRLRINGSVYCTVASSSFGSGNTTVNTNETTVPGTISSLEIAIEPENFSDAYAIQSQVDTDIAAVKDGVRDNTYAYAADAGSTDAYAITLSPVPSAYVAGMEILFKANTINTGACTLDVNTLGAKALKTPDGADLPTGYIKAGNLVKVAYDGTNFVVLSVTGIDGWVDLTDGATINIDLSLGRKFRIRDMAGNRTLTVSNALVGMIFELEIWQDGTGSRLISEWFTGDSTFATGDVDTGTDVITVGRDIPTGTPIKFTSSGAVPAGLVAGTKYYAIRQSATSIKVASSLANAQAGTSINITDQGSGTHTIRALIRWKSNTEPTLSTGKYLIDTFVFTNILTGIFKGILVDQEGS